MIDPDWEYGFHLCESDTDEIYDAEEGFDTASDAQEAGLTRAAIEDDEEYPPLIVHVVRRRRPTDWVRFEPEGGDDGAG